MTRNPENAPLAVIKVGGDVLLDETQKHGLVANVKGLVGKGWRVVLLHGGGPQVSNLQERLGIPVNKIAGRRVTSVDDLVVVKQALCGQVNVDLVSILVAQGVDAFGCHGASGQIILAKRRPPIVISGGGPKPIDFGEVGDVETINTKVLKTLLDNDLVPVIASLGVSKEGQIFNINADTTVVQIARKMSAELLIFVTGVGAIYENIKDPTSRLATLNEESAKHLIECGVIVDGMIPKVEEALSLLKSGVDAIAIVDTRNSNAFAEVASGSDLFGTRITD